MATPPPGWVACDLLAPELDAGSGQPEERTIVPMPEAAENEDHGAKPRKDDVGLLGSRG